MPKKPVKNSFSFYLDDYWKEEKAKGRILSKALASEECAKYWRDMAPEDKAYYEDLNRSYKARLKTDLTQKFTSDGKSYAQIQAEEKEKELRIATMVKDIQNSILRKSPDSELPKVIFHLIHVNYYCRTNAGQYWPAELAVSCFSLGDGLIKTYHTLVNPGQLPTGYTYEAKENSDQIHKLPLPPYEAGENNFATIYDSIVGLLEINGAKEVLPPVYALPTNLEACESVIVTLERGCSGRQHPGIRVYPLDELYYCLRNHCASYANVEGFPQKSLAKADLDRDIFCYTPDIACEFHNEIDGTEHKCSLSVVKRYCYTICDMCSKNLNIPLLGGAHVPRGMDLTRSSRMSSTATSRAVSSRYASTIASSLYGDHDYEDNDEGDEDVGLSVNEAASYYSGHGSARAGFQDVRFRSTSSHLYEEQNKKTRPLKEPKHPAGEMDHFPTLGGLNIAKNRKPK